MPKDTPLLRLLRLLGKLSRKDELFLGRELSVKFLRILRGNKITLGRAVNTGNSLQISGDQFFEQADQGIARISEVVQCNSAAAQESYATSEELTAQATTMHELVSRFQLKK